MASRAGGGMAGGRGGVAGRGAWMLATLGLTAAATSGAYLWYSGGLDAFAAAGAARPLHRGTITVVPGIHMLGALSPSAAYVVETTDGLILVDTGLDRDARPLKAEMARLGLDWRRIRAILLTHVHGDHTGGARTLRAETGARVYAGAGDAAALRAGGPRDAFFSIFSMPDRVPHPTDVDVELRGGETITVGDVRVEAIAAPGHTPGSVCYLAHCRGRRALFAGDVIMMLRGDEPPRGELGKPLGTYSAYLPPHYRGDARETLATLRRLRRLAVPDLVLPGHPGAQRAPEDPRLTRRRWETILDAGIRDMEDLLAHFEADGADFLDGNPRPLLPDLDYLGDRDGAAVYAFVAGSRLHLVDAPGGPGLAGFVDERRRQLGRAPAKPSAVLLTGCGPAETAGLRELVDACHPEVIAASAGIERLRALLPAGTVISPAEELGSRGGFPVTTIPLGGRGLAPIGYRLTWAGKAVLISGRIPVKMSQEAGESLIADLTHPPGDVREYFASLTRLHDASPPDLWLPAVPTQGQNANLYGDEWIRELDQNLGVVRAILSASQRR